MADIFPINPEQRDDEWLVLEDPMIYQQQVGSILWSDFDTTKHCIRNGCSESLYADVKEDSLWSNRDGSSCLLKGHLTMTYCTKEKRKMWDNWLIPMLTIYSVSAQQLPLDPARDNIYILFPLWRMSTDHQGLYLQEPHGCVVNGELKSANWQCCTFGLWLLSICW